MKEGGRLGDLKPEPLSTQTGWSDWFDGTYEEATRGARP